LLVYTGSVSSADLDHRPSERSELVGSDGARSEGARRHFRGSGSSCHPASGTRRCTALVPGRRPMPCWPSIAATSSASAPGHPCACCLRLSHRPDRRRCARPRRRSRADRNQVDPNVMWPDWLRQSGRSQRQV